MPERSDPEKKYYGPRRGDGMGEWRDETPERHADPMGERPPEPEVADDDDHLPTISLLRVPHPTIANLYQYCFEYLEPWSWSVEAERVETGKWFFARPGASESGLDDHSS